MQFHKRKGVVSALDSILWSLHRWVRRRVRSSWKISWCFLERVKLAHKSVFLGNLAEQKPHFLLSYSSIKLHAGQLLFVAWSRPLCYGNNTCVSQLGVWPMIFQGLDFTLKICLCCCCFCPICSCLIIRWSIMWLYIDSSHFKNNFHVRTVFVSLLKNILAFDCVINNEVFQVQSFGH